MSREQANPAALIGGLANVLWEEYWHLICHRSELPIHGDFVKFEVGDDEVVVFNDHGELVAFDNRCPHRGARIFEAEAGNQSATCQYHGWTFSNGKMIVPRPEEFSRCDLSRVELRRWQTAWIGDFLFVGKQPLQSIDEQLSQTRNILEDLSFGIDGRVDFNAYKFECDWPIAIENALEPYHVAMIHPQSLGKLDLEEGENSFFGRNSVWYSRLGNQRMAKQLESLKRFFNLDYQFEGYMSLYLFPFTMLSSTYGYSYSLQSFYPSSQTGSTNFSSRLLKMALRPGLEKTAMDSFFASTANVNRRVFDEDNRICKRVPSDSWSLNPPLFFADSESKVLHFRQSCREALIVHGADE